MWIFNSKQLTNIETGVWMTVRDNKEYRPSWEASFEASVEHGTPAGAASVDGYSFGEWARTRIYEGTMVECEDYLGQMAKKLNALELPAEGTKTVQEPQPDKVISAAYYEDDILF